MSAVLDSSIDMKKLDSRHETVTTPHELVSAAEDAQQRFSKHNILNERHLFMQFYKALDAAYRAVTDDPTLGSKYKQLLDETVNNSLAVQSGRESEEDAKGAYRVVPYSPFWNGLLGTATTCGVDFEGTLFLLRKVISTK